jgi:hypothetical protein
MRGCHTVVARVIWSQRERIGLIAQDRICLAALVGQANSGRPRGMPNANGRRTGRARRADQGQYAAKTVRTGTLIFGGGVIGWLALSLIHEAFAGPMQSIAAALGP